MRKEIKTFEKIMELTDDSEEESDSGMSKLEEARKKEIKMMHIQYLCQGSNLCTQGDLCFPALGSKWTCQHQDSTGVLGFGYHHGGCGFFNWIRRFLGRQDA